MRKIEDFEPGSIVCEDCKSRPDDPWDFDPDGFRYFEQFHLWLCDECRIQLVN